MSDKHLLDSGITCVYDGEPIEYTDLVIVLLMIKPHIMNGQLFFYDIRTEDQDDYLYEPVFYHGKNWDEVEEEFEQYVRETPAMPVSDAILHCRYCKSGILAGETTGVALTGEVHRSQRNPDLEPYGNHFDPLDTAPIIICVACVASLNSDVHEMWPDGVSHNDECKEGTYARCWRDSCPGDCPNKNPED